MGLTLDPGTLIEGHRPAILKQVLRHLERRRDPVALGELRSVFGSRKDAACAYDVCVRQGWVDPVSHALTDAGQAVVRARLLARTMREKALAVLNSLLSRIEAFNADPDQLSLVDEVWLFGSLMRGESNVGDIDLAIGTSRRPEFSGRVELMIERAGELCARHGGAPNAIFHWYHREQWLLERGIFGPRRHALLAGAHTGLNDLVAIGAPCKLIFDRLNGGRLDGPILDRHPGSAGFEPDVRN